MSDTFDPGEGWTQVPAHEGIGKDRIVRIDPTDIARQAWVRKEPIRLPTAPYTVIMVKWVDTGMFDAMLTFDGATWSADESGSWFPHDLVEDIKSFKVLAVPVSED